MLNLDVDYIEAEEHLRTFGRNGLMAQVMRLELVGKAGQQLGAVRVLPDEVRVDRWGQEVRHLRLKYLPRDGSALVNVPVALVGEESAPGVKGGSRLHVLNDTVPLVCQGWAVPPRFELDTGDYLRFRDLTPPAGCELRAENPRLPVVRCAPKGVYE
ncbi:hypothetical protein MNEG_9317 [Monoraphidium neglectum]|uniref:Large ribosomal subunit protein bL25 beta domain-containing protein n=1 Tax=Monoraphidium neglectum TaxID=145388 RepID=A0A0D2MWQ8_9CHLO|nr:hypothetical protein MNEG_9317 [Monoraphidium neglectum]KIY98645.1 hypothetical protein MNEG_9317 [Monoraphidium neglectum]|eukprot:XP_013897665.1 hypothetical protein MNEG_9317 [Monoraphidium neglectum]